MFNYHNKLQLNRFVRWTYYIQLEVACNRQSKETSLDRIKVQKTCIQYAIVNCKKCGNEVVTSEQVVKKYNKISEGSSIQHHTHSYYVTQPSPKTAALFFLVFFPLNLAFILNSFNWPFVSSVFDYS